MDEGSLDWRRQYGIVLLLLSTLCGLPILIGLFVLYAALLHFVPFMHTWTGSAIAIGAIAVATIPSRWFGEYMLIENGWPRPNRHFFCTGSGCGNHIPDDLPWKCGFCPSVHALPRGPWSFLGRCQTCKREPPAYECHYCGELLILIRPSVPPTEGFEQRHAARHASGHLPGQTHEEVHAGHRRARDLTEATTLLTRAQTEGLRAEIEHLRESRRLQMLKNETKQEKVDPVASFGQQLDEAIASSTTTIQTKQQLREMIQSKQAMLEASEGFRRLGEDGQRRARELFAMTADKLERSVQNQAKPPSR